MRALRVVGLTEDGDVVLEDPVRLERYTVPADERLRAAARGDLSRLGQIAIELESQLRPREIQARIRAGASVEQVATAAGVPEQKIERFAYPVMLERFRTADNAQRAHPMRADGPDSRTLGDVVAHTFGLRGQAYEGVKWDSWKGEDGRWVVALSWRAGRSDNRAHWVFQPGAHGGTVTALDEHASDLVEGLPARPLRTVGAVVDMTRPEEEPPPAPSPVEQWRAAASDSYREQRLPTAPDTGRRTPAEPWRPAPPQRQTEPPAAYRTTEPPADPRAGREPYREPLADPRPAGRGDVYRESEPLADPRPARSGTYPRPSGPAGYRPADARPPVPQPDVAPSPPPERRGSTASAEWAPWERGVRTAAPSAPPAPPVPATSVPGDDVVVPAARTAPPADEAVADAATPPAIPAPPTVTPQVEPIVVQAEIVEEAEAVEEPVPTEAPSHPLEIEASPASVPPTEAEVEPVVAPAIEPSAAEVEPLMAEPSGTEPSDTAAATEPDGTGAPDAASAAEPAGSEPSGTAADVEPGGSEPSGTTAAADASDETAAESTPVEPAATKAPAGAAAKRTRKGKPVMPSWDEVLLGVRGPR